MPERLADLALLALFENYAEGRNRSVGADEREGGDDQAEPASPMDEAVVDKPEEDAEDDESGDRGDQWPDAA